MGKAGRQGMMGGGEGRRDGSTSGATLTEFKGKVKDTSPLSNFQ